MVVAGLYPPSPSFSSFGRNPANFLFSPPKNQSAQKALRKCNQMFIIISMPNPLHILLRVYYGSYSEYLFTCFFFLFRGLVFLSLCIISSFSFYFVCFAFAFAFAFAFIFIFIFTVYCIPGIVFVLFVFFRYFLFQCI